MDEALRQLAREGIFALMLALFVWSIVTERLVPGPVYKRRLDEIQHLRELEEARNAREHRTAEALDGVADGMKLLLDRSQRPPPRSSK